MAKAKLVWRERALLDIQRLYDFVATKNEQAAPRVAKVILHSSALLIDSPHLGRPMADGTKRRELFIPFGSGFYVLRYMLKNEYTVVVIRVWHSKENRK